MPTRIAPSGDPIDRAADHRPTLPGMLGLLIGGRRAGVRVYERGAALYLARHGVFVELDPAWFPEQPERGCRDV